MMTKMAVVTAVEGAYLRLRFLGEETVSGKRYLRTCGASVGDRVICLLVEGAYIAVGVIQEGT